MSLAAVLSIGLTLQVLSESAGDGWDILLERLRSDWETPETELSYPRSEKWRSGAWEELRSRLRADAQARPADMEETVRRAYWDSDSWDGLRKRLEQALIHESKNQSPAAAGNRFHGSGKDRERFRFYSCRLGVPPALAFAVADVESAWNPEAISHKGARGILQVMPGTAEQYGLDPKRLLDFDYGSYAGLVILRDLLDRFEAERPALAAYVAGPGFWKKSYSRETEQEIARYVRKVLQKKRDHGGERCSE